MTVVLYRDEDHDIDIRLVCEFEGLDEDNRPQFIVERGYDLGDEVHRECDLSFVGEEW